MSDSQQQALKRLWKIANGHSGQCQVVAKFLLGLYNGTRFLFDLTDFRSLDEPIFRDCLLVLTFDYRCVAEVHDLLGVPGHEFERLAEAWSVKDYGNGG